MHNFGEFLREAIAAADSVLEPKTVKSLVHNYGTEYVNVLKYTHSSPELGETIGQTETIKAQVVHAVREEMAVKLGDVLFRRTDIASGGWPGDAPVKICAEVMGAELGWDRARTQKEVENTRACFFSNGSKTWRKSIL
jgi:glycerol-3-phosphate dehydrogenase